MCLLQARRQWNGDTVAPDATLTLGRRVQQSRLHEQESLADALQAARRLLGVVAAAKFELVGVDAVGVNGRA